MTLSTTAEPAFATSNAPPATSRTQVVELLNWRLADALDLQSQCKQAHWNVKGPQFIALHKSFDDVYAGVAEHAVSAFGSRMRLAIGEADELDDAATAEASTEIARGATNGCGSSKPTSRA